MAVKIEIDHRKCMGCGNCVAVCPANRKADPAVALSGAVFSDNVVLRVINGVACVINESLCLARVYDCSACMDVCPSGALKLTKYPRSKK
ncbi:MAG: ATP-binding protein [Candidatus Baldrarchaeia archaeon]